MKLVFGFLKIKILYEEYLPRTPEYCLSGAVSVRGEQFVLYIPAL